MAPTSPWHIYAEQLFWAGYGYPLWVPDGEGGEPFIGDVGWMRQGEFRPLFNSREDAEDPIHFDKGVPQNFTVLDRLKLGVTGKDHLIKHQFVCGQNLRQKVLKGPKRRSPVGYAFDQEGPSGAFLFLPGPPITESITAGGHIKWYMRENFPHWVEFANASDGWGLNLTDQDILFISGTTKTTHWKVAAWSEDVVKWKEGNKGISGTFNPSAPADISVVVNGQFVPPTHVKIGPAGRDPESQSLAARHSDQCVFINYFKMKRRSGSAPIEYMRAAAGPHDLPPGPGERGSDCVTATRGVIKSDDSNKKTYDPVVDLLDYILEHTDAEAAVASNLDFAPLLPMSPVPPDVPKFLRRTRPPIAVNEHRLGTIAWDREPSASSAILRADTRHETDIPICRPGDHPLRQAAVKLESINYDAPTSAPHVSPRLVRDHDFLRRAFYKNIAFGVGAVKRVPWPPIELGDDDALRSNIVALLALSTLHCGGWERTQRLGSKGKDAVTITFSIFSTSGRIMTADGTEQTCTLRRA
ncbi:hypothetical protein BD309DRAFT_955063 [Dichomitus squalens]|nr:hypothetical protein BD309DRAFT_955063 [Dichomitus squalens]